MRHVRAFLILPAFATLAAAPVLAQDAEASDEASARTREYAPTQLAYSKLSVGTTAVLEDASGERLGVMRNHVIERATGRLLAIVVETGFEGDADHKTVAVPFDRFLWNAETGSLLLPMDAETLGTLPAYDPEDLQSVTASPRKARAVEATRTNDKVRNLAAAGILEAKVLGTDEPFGAVTEILFEPKHGEVAFLVVQGNVPSANGMSYVVPFKAAEWKKPEDPAAERGSFHIGMTVAEIAEAPKLDQGGIRALENPKTVEHIYRYYGIERPMEGSAPPADSHRTSG
jgi:hypothetical protein